MAERLKSSSEVRYLLLYDIRWVGFWFVHQAKTVIEQLAYDCIISHHLPLGGWSHWIRLGGLGELHGQPPARL